jgi:hypothetical protein
MTEVTFILQAYDHRSEEGELVRQLREVWQAVHPQRPAQRREDHASRAGSAILHP